MTLPTQTSKVCCPLTDVKDGFTRRDLPRRYGVDGKLLPSARLVSNVVHVNSETPVGTTLTSLYSTFGQSLSHDLSDTPLESGRFCFQKCVYLTSYWEEN